MSPWLKSRSNKGMKNVCVDCDKRYLCHAICNNMDLIKQKLGNDPSERAQFDSLRMKLEENEFGYPLSYRFCDFALSEGFASVLKILDDQANLYEKVDKTQG